MLCGADPGMRDVVYSTSGAQEQKLDVYFPKGHEPGKSPALPAVLCIHGGGWAGGQKTDMAPFAAALAEQGYVGVCISYRLFHAEKHPENVWPAQYDDAQAAVRWMRAHAAKLGINPQKIAALGASAGGHLVALLGTTDTRAGEGRTFPEHSSRVNAVVDVFGPTELTGDFTALRIGPVSVQSVVDDFIGKQKPAAEQEAAKKAASPALLVDGKCAPFLIFHGAKDTIVPVEQSRLMERVLKKAGIPVKYVEWPTEGHGLGAPGSMESFRQEISAFLSRTLGAK